MTNYGNKYKFNAIMKRRMGKKNTVLIQSTKKDGSWGKVRETERFGCETDEQVIKRLNELNPGTKFRLAQAVEM